MSYVEGEEDLYDDVNSNGAENKNEYVPNEEGRYIGTVKWYDSAKGFGFIKSDVHSEDIFVHSSQLPQDVYALHNNQEVEFTLIFENEKPKAQQITGKYRSKLEQPHISRTNPDFARRLQSKPNILLGTIKWFDNKTSYGFIRPENNGDDVFVHSNDIVCTAPPPFVKVGQEVEYETLVETNESGKTTIRAKNVTLPGGGKFVSLDSVQFNHNNNDNQNNIQNNNNQNNNPSMNIQATKFNRSIGVKGKVDPIIRTGTVKWFKDSKKYGFIIPSDGSPEIFVHLNNILPAGFNTLTPGQIVEYITEYRDDGTTRAVGITGLNGRLANGSIARPDNMLLSQQQQQQQQQRPPYPYAIPYGYPPPYGMPFPFQAPFPQQAQQQQQNLTSQEVSQRKRKAEDNTTPNNKILRPLHTYQYPNPYEMYTPGPYALQYPSSYLQPPPPK